MSIPPSSLPQASPTDSQPDEQNEVPRGPACIQGRHGRSDFEVEQDIWRELHKRFPDRFWSAGPAGLLHQLKDGLLQPVTVAALRPLAVRAVTLTTTSRNGTVTHKPIPQEMLSSLIHGAARNCCRIDAMTSCPFLTQDGGLVFTPGYHPASRIWLHLDDLAQPVDSWRASETEVSEVLRRLLDFPFRSDSDCAHALGLLLLPLLRPGIRGATPIHLIESSGPGAGKTYLARLAGVIGSGREPEARSWAAWRQEQQRQLDTYLGESPTFLLLDNVVSASTLGGSDLHRAISATGPIAFRPIGSGKEVKATVRCIWIATGNNPSLDDELLRRTVPIRLLREPNRGHLTEDLVGWATNNRLLVLRVLCQLVQVWLDAERPAPPESLQGFGQWSDIVGGVVTHAGYAGWLAPAHRPSTEDRGEWGVLYGAWPLSSSGSSRALRPVEAVDLVDELGLHGLQELLGGGSVASRSTRMGKLLAGKVEQSEVLSGFRLVRMRQRAGNAYRPLPVGGGRSGAEVGSTDSSVRISCLSQRQGTKSSKP